MPINKGSNCNNPFNKPSTVRPTMFRKSFLLSFLLIGVATSPSAFAEVSANFESGHTALQVFDQTGISSMPLWLKVWIGIMMITFASGLLFVWKHPIARWAVGGFLMPFLVMGEIINALGWPFLSGSIALAHLIFWTPALLLLLWKRPFLDTNQGIPFRIWSTAMTGVILFSFIFDIRDSVIYVTHLSAI